MAITAKDVQDLRKSTGAGMMDAKKALTEADGDFEAAVQILREKGLAKAATRSDRENTEGLVVIAENDGAAALVHLRSETDFSAKSDDFAALANDIAAAVLADGEAAVAGFEARLEDLRLTVKENIELGAVARYEKRADPSSTPTSTVEDGPESSSRPKVSTPTHSTRSPSTLRSPSRGSCPGRHPRRRCRT